MSDLFSDVRTKRPKKWVRLSCDAGCFTEHDGITEAKLAKLKSSGWTNIRVNQTWDESIDVSDGADMSNWETHLGTCPDCSKE